MKFINVSQRLKDSVKVKWASPYMTNKSESDIKSEVVKNTFKLPDHILGNTLSIPIHIYLNENYFIKRFVTIYIHDSKEWPQIYWHKLAKKYLPGYKYGNNTDPYTVPKLIIPIPEVKLLYYRPFSFFAGKTETLEARIYKVYNVRKEDMNSSFLVKWKGYPNLVVPFGKEDEYLIKSYAVKWGGIVNPKDVTPRVSNFTLNAENIWVAKAKWKVPLIFENAKNNSTISRKISAELIKK